MRSVVNLVQSQVYQLSVHFICLQHVRCNAARRAGLSATADPCSDRFPDVELVELYRVCRVLDV